MIIRMVSPCVSAAWLRHRLVDGLKNLRVVDGRYLALGAGFYLFIRITTGIHYRCISYSSTAHVTGRGDRKVSASCLGLNLAQGSGWS